jgi:hypothetical protein
MTEAYQALAEEIAQAIVSQDYVDIIGASADWMQKTTSPGMLQRLVKDKLGDREQPVAYNIVASTATLDSLSLPKPNAFPSRPLPVDITEDNYRQLLQISFLDQQEQRLFDFWLVIVTVEENAKAGFFEVTTPL